MGFISDIFSKIDSVLSKYIQPIVDKIIEFLSKDQNTVIAIIIFFAALLILIGLFRMIFKTPRFFITLVVIFAIAIGLYYFSK